MAEPVRLHLLANHDLYYAQTRLRGGGVFLTSAFADRHQRDRYVDGRVEAWRLSAVDRGASFHPLNRGHLDPADDKTTCPCGQWRKE